MLLWITRPDPIHYPVKCHACGKEGADALCNHCGLPFCGQHRVGSGSLDDGYECMNCWGKDDIPPLGAREILRKSRRLANFLSGIGAICLGLAIGTAIVWMFLYIIASMP